MIKFIVRVKNGNILLKANIQISGNTVGKGINRQVGKRNKLSHHYDFYLKFTYLIYFKMCAAL